MAQDKTYIEIGSDIPANGTSARKNPSGVAAMNIQINAGANVTSVIEGVLADIQGAEQPQESDWVEVARFVGPGIFPLKNVPSLFRVKALGGSIERVRAMGYRDPKAIPETLPASLADITSAVDPIVEPVRTTANAAQVLAEQADTKADSASNLAEKSQSALGNLTLIELSTRPISAGPQLADGSRWVGEASGTPNGGTVVAASGGGVWVREYTGPVKTGWGVGLPADAPAEITGNLTRTTRYGVPDGLRVRGVGRVASVISAGGAAAGTTIISTTPAARTDGTATFYAQGGENLGSVTLDGTGAGANVTGLAVEGSYKTVRDITVRRFTTGVRMGLTHCFANNVDTFDIHNNDIGVAFPVGVTNSGERVTFSNGTIFNNLYNLTIDGPEWFIHLFNVSLDYPNNAHMAISNPTSLHMTGGHIEGERPLVYGVNANQEIGHITVTGATLVQLGADWRTLTWAELFPAAGGTFCRGTLFLRDCVEGFSKQRVNRVLTHYVPPAAPVAGTTYTNESAATLHVAVTLTLAPGDALLRVGGVVRDRAGISAGSLTTTLKASVPPYGTFLLETAGAVTGISGQYDLA